MSADRRTLTALALTAIVLAGLFALLSALSAASKRAQSLAAFETFAPVFNHPRCLNCHRSDLPRVRDDARAVAGGPGPSVHSSDLPRVRDDARDHVPRVRPGNDGGGMGGEQCWICHHDRNNEITAIPGAPGWRMPPYLMSWDGLSLVDICDNIKDPSINGGRTLRALEQHFHHDHLIAWAWRPGNMRSTPPLAYDTFKHAVSRWLETGAVCPT